MGEAGSASGSRHLPLASGPLTIKTPHALGLRLSLRANCAHLLHIPACHKSRRLTQVERDFHLASTTGANGFRRLKRFHRS
jgi:hypothetical protein